jgi:hypothetical protein
MIRFQTYIDLDSPDEYVAPLSRLVPHLRDRGITFDSQRGDLIFADGATLPEQDDRPAVLLDRSDSAALWWMFQPQGNVARRILKSARVLGLMKISRYTDQDAYNQPATDESVHSQRIRSAAGDDIELAEFPSRPMLGAREFKKLILGPGFWAFDACALQAEDPVNFDDPRSLDVFCAITVNYGCPAINWHRRAALKQITSIRGRRAFITRGRVLPSQVYQYLLRQARICVSPWGWGETCHRDYEALAAGCVLIKPKTDFVDSMLPLDERHYVPCMPDFCDLKERIADVLDNWSAYRVHREAGREHVMRARDPQWLADQCAASLLAAVRGGL